LLHLRGEKNSRTYLIEKTSIVGIGVGICSSSGGEGHGNGTGGDDGVAQP
jgi:hypothetical protein